MTNKQALTELIRAVEAGNADYGNFAKAFVMTDRIANDYHGNWAKSAYNGSVDAAIRFLEAVLPEWLVSEMLQFENGVWNVVVTKWDEEKRKRYYGMAGDKILGRALLLATLKALESEQ